MAKQLETSPVTTVSARHIRVAPRKVRLVADLIRGKSVVEAERILAFTVKPSVTPHMIRLLKAAKASAQNDHSVNPEELFIGDLQVDGGPMMKRFRARAYGRPGRILKRSSHIRMTLSELNEGDA